jgi:hypothetical protein
MLYEEYAHELECHRRKGERNCLWRICALPKAKHLLWRMCRGCLSSRVQLRERFMNCPSCLKVVEDDWHIFFRLWGEQKCLGWSGSWYFHWGYVMLDICNKEDDTVTYRIALVEWVMRKWGTIVTIGFGTMPRTRPMGVLWVLYITGPSGMLRTTYNNAPLLLLMVGESANLM